MRGKYVKKGAYVVFLGYAIQAYAWICKQERAQMKDITYAEMIGGLIMILGLIISLIA